MLNRRMMNRWWLMLVLACMQVTVAFAADESYIQTLTGKIKKGDSCTVIDDKFLNMPLTGWNQVRNMSVNNVISFELRFDTAFLYNKAFTCTLNVSIQYFTSRDQQQPTEINNVSLVVKYDTARGSFYPVTAQYKFKDAFKVLVIVNSITSPELGAQLPPVFRLKNQILVQRKYPFTGTATGGLDIVKENTAAGNQAMLRSINLQPDGQLKFTWATQNFPYAGEYDIEWTFIDAQSDWGKTIATQYTSNGVINFPDAKAEGWMLNNSTRVTVAAPPYNIYLPYADGYVLARIRGVGYNAQDVRVTTDWQYRDGTELSVIKISAHDPGHNWQYTAAFAEEGKRKEVITYFDATLRNRQAVTISSDETLKQNSTTDRQKTTVVHETVYDDLGRPALNFLPAPTDKNSLHFIPSFNVNEQGQPYSHKDINLNGNGTICTIGAAKAGNNNGAGKYYSSSNAFLNDPDYYFNKYVPDAEQYPFVLTEYTKDNTGRIRRQGGVGKAFQNGNGHETQYYYGKPAQKELDRIFGSEVGNASHYLKNMVVDPNGQISVSYIDANGKTIATALAGLPPANVTALASSNSNEARVRLNQRLIGANDFNRDATALLKKSSATFLAAVTGQFKVNYSVYPAALTTIHGQGLQFCSNCYYEVLVEVRDECGNLKATASTAPFTGSDITCHTTAEPVNGTLQVPIDKIGAYTVQYTLRLSEETIKYHTDYYINNNSNLKKLQAFFEEELQKLDLSGCYTDCESCKTLGNTPDAFREKVVALLLTDKFQGIAVGAAGSPVRQWIDAKYTELKQKCAAISCNAANACEDYLVQMKEDVKPGGQYALYNYDEATDTYVYTERTINVLKFYNLNDGSNTEIYNFSFTGDGGQVKYIRDLTESDFIKAYLAHPDWADMFVKKHIEYCSYLWCKNSAPLYASNETSYNFDKTLRQLVKDGADAVSRDYYNRNNINALLDADPLFNGSGRGASLKAQIQQDLANFSATIKFIVKDNNGVQQPVKNIFAFIDWLLYCKPVDQAATGTDFLNSWNSCAVNTTCHSITREWELYRNYYLQLKSKYLKQLKEAAMPGCTDCFIGQDVITQQVCTTPDINDFQVIADAAGSQPKNYYVIYKTGQLPFPNNYIVNYTAGGVSRTATVKQGDLRVLLLSNAPESTFPGSITSVNCENAGELAGCASNSTPCPVNADFELEERNVENFLPGQGCTARTWDEYLKYKNGPVTRRVSVRIKTVYSKTNSESYNWYTLAPGMDAVNVGSGFIHHSRSGSPGVTCDGASLSFYIANDLPVCDAVVPSVCNNDPQFAAYKNKNRIFNDYVNMDGYMDCLAATPPAQLTNQQLLDRYRQEAIVDLESLKINWLGRLTAVRDGEPAFSGITDNTIAQLTDALYNIAKTNIDNAVTPETIRAASTLPANLQYGNYHNFAEAFNDKIGATLVQQGFSHYLLDKPYPFDKTPFTLNPGSGGLNTVICNNIAAFRSRYIASGFSGSFHAYLQQELEDDYMLTAAALSNLETRCTSGCRYMEEPLLLPVAFVTPVPANTDHPGVTCTRVSTLNSQFATLFPGVLPNSSLHALLYTNFMNHSLGYPLAYSEYLAFSKKCLVNAQAMLYNKPAIPVLQQDDLFCVTGLLQGAYERGGQEYDRYITLERIRFRNQYISTCLSNQAAASIEGDQYEYHYTLYYYDQSGNLVKTIPPEGVRFLSEEEIAKVDEYRGRQYTGCNRGQTPRLENGGRILSLLSDYLESGQGKSLEFWLYSNQASKDREIRLITPDEKYLFQAAIHDKKLWVELYTLSPNGNGGIDLTLANRAVAGIGNSTLQNWSHLFIQAEDFFTDSWDIYLDSKKLTLLPPAGAPPYPFAWQTGNGATLPQANTIYMKYMRLYNRLATVQEIAGNYQNDCLLPVESLSQTVVVFPPQPDALLLWGRFNVPEPGSETTTGPGSTYELVDRFITPLHGLPANYAYNSLNKVVKQSSPDGGTFEFWYDRLVRLVVSQNAEQKEPRVINASNPANRYSYTRYDVLGRIAEVGEKTGSATTVTEQLTRDNSALGAFYAAGSNRQVTITAYDQAPAWAPAGLLQRNLRKRVTATALLSAGNNGAVNRLAASYYSYDIMGNVDEQVQENTVLAAREAQFVTGSDGLKHIQYEYDLVSGKVNKVLYQPGKWDQFFYAYRYDGDNRLIEARTSRDQLTWYTEAAYRYYLHGPLARMELGHDDKKVQGLDYAYTLQGWLKGVNNNYLGAADDMGQDGMANGVFKEVARDAIGFSLHYYKDNSFTDYKAIDATSALAFKKTYDPSGAYGKSLYNGNISAMTVTNSALGGGAAVGYAYSYDQLNRLVNMRFNTGLGNGAGTWSATAPYLSDAYKEDVTYDANGNIQSYRRNGANTAASPLPMDQLTYHYNTDADGFKLNNRLRHVTDQITAVHDDIGSQPADNYTYDKIGNLVADQAEGLNEVNWTVYGKIGFIKKSNTEIYYGYDAGGSRITKTVISSGSATGTHTTYYVRDAQGNVLGVYKYSNAGGVNSFGWEEQHLYGSSRLGILLPRLVILSGQPLANAAYNASGDGTQQEGNRYYELTNHLGNVLATITDKKIGVPSAGNSSLIDHYEAEVTSANDYYPFGMLMPGRKWSSGSYRYGFNGKENDNEVKGEGNQQDYGMRISDPRLGRFLSVDPLTKSYPFYTPYAFAGNKPILAVDLDGAEEKPMNDQVAQDLAITSVMTIWEIRNSVTNTFLRINPDFHSEMRGEAFSKIGIHDPEMERNYQLRMRTVIVEREEIETRDGIEVINTYRRSFVLEPLNSTGREFLQAGLDVLNIASVLVVAKAGGGSTVLFEKGTGAIVMSTWRASMSLLYNIKRFSSVGVNNGLQGVHKLADVMEAGMAFVGKNAKKVYAQGGRFIGWESADGLKRFRPSAFKKNMGKNQSNFEQRTSSDIDWESASGAKSRSNMHVDTDQKFDFNSEKIPPRIGTSNK